MVDIKNPRKTIHVVDNIRKAMLKTETSVQHAYGGGISTVASEAFL